MKEAGKKASLMSVGLILITAGYSLFQEGEYWPGLAAILVGLLLVFSSQAIHIEREELNDLKMELNLLKGKVK